MILFVSSDLMKQRILFVCLGNICRSPAAEAILLNKLQKLKLIDQFDVDSAGTGNWHVGKLADSRMREAASNRGISIKSRGRQISFDDFSQFDLILTMDNDNLKQVQSLAKELSTTSKAQIKPLLSYSNQTNLIDVPDPYYGGDKGFDQVLDLLEVAIDGLIEDIRVV